MKPGDHLVDDNREQTPYRVEGIAATGERYQIAELYDEEEARVVAGRAILYGDEAGRTSGVKSRRMELKRQWRFLRAVADAGTAPQPVEWLEIEESPVEYSPEPVLICEKIDGPTVYDWITEEFPTGLGLERALELTADLADFLCAAHGAGWLWCDFDPRRFRIEDGDRIRAVSVGGIIEVGEPVSAQDRPFNADYVAPELRDDVAPNVQRAAGDLYGLGALASFLLSAEEPRHRVESPLSFDAYERIEERGAPGVRLLLAKLLQPMAAKRLATAEEFRPYCAVDSLPTRQTPGFEHCELPAPWLGLDIETPEENRGLRSSLSAGPLVSMSREGGEAVAEQAGGELDWRVIAAVLVVTVVVVLLGVLVGG